MAVISQYFLCPVIAKICKKVFNMSDTVAGVTLMAWANGSNDFLGCTTAFMTKRGSLALAELIGAGKMRNRLA
jgi:sodium/potassium/calcium exchanger 6